MAATNLSFRSRPMTSNPLTRQNGGHGRPELAEPDHGDSRLRDRRHMSLIAALSKDDDRPAASGTIRGVVRFMQPDASLAHAILAERLLSRFRHVLFELSDPGIGMRIARRAPVPARRKRAARADLRTVRHGGTLELADLEKTEQEQAQPFANGRKIIGALVLVLAAPPARRPLARRARHSRKGRRPCSAASRSA